ncbi:hypothetical protein KC717_01665 [Candidatus Dojkabacteria bacterium]|uniref:Uncharacterized protein n=1 Tax=Candidatus Dojkabacteria bacterium TaxID=2099670 RepID=A0A955L7Y3_9BACT|nr:hypothetical protein [Candidatus Dojkabacteria bacterium]
MKQTTTPSIRISIKKQVKRQHIKTLEQEIKNLKSALNDSNGFLERYLSKELVELKDERNSIRQSLYNTA